MKIFLDKELTQEIKDDILPFGIVSAGEVGKRTYYVLNDEGCTLVELEFSLVPIETRENDKVEISEAPTELPPSGVGEVIVVWDASVKLEQGLKIGLDINGIRQFD